MPASQRPSWDVSVALVGEGGTGKSALLHRLVTGRFDQRIPPTFGPEFAATRVPVAGAAAAATVGVWDLSGRPSFHALSQRFLCGADAVLCCFDAASRSSWDAARAWVAEAQAEAPAARIHLAACKTDLLAPRQQPAGPPIDVEVERWRSGTSVEQPEEQPEEQRRQQRQQQREEEQQPEEQQQQPQGKPLAGGGFGGGRRPHERLPSEPRTPTPASERPPTPDGHGEEAEGPKPGGSRQPALEPAGPEEAPASEGLASRPAAAPEVVVESAADVTAAELLASPFAVAAQLPLLGSQLPSPTSPPADEQPGSSRPAAEAGLGQRAPGSGGPITFGPCDWDRLGERQAQQAQQAQQAGDTPAPRQHSVHWHDQQQGRLGQQQQQEEQEEEQEEQQRERRERREWPLTRPLAVPEAVIEHFAGRIGARVFWLSGATGEGVAAAFAAMAQDVLEQRLSQRQQAQAQAQAQQRAGGGRRSSWGGSQRGSGSVSPFVQAAAAQQQQQQAQSQQGHTRRRSADGVPADRGSRGRLEEPGGGRARARSVQHRPHEYEVDSSELGRGQLEEDSEPSCRIS